MFSLKLIMYSFLIFYVILYTKSDRISIASINKLDKLLKYSGWLNKNDLFFVKYFNRTYCLRNLIETPTPKNKYNQKIRALTVFLGCSYAKVMNNLFLVISNIIQICKKKIITENEYLNVCFCTEELVNIISLLIVPLAKLMKGAMDNLDYMHSNPWILQSNYYMMSPLLRDIENILDNLNERTLTRDNLSTYLWTLNTINDFFQKIKVNVDYQSLVFCRYVSNDENYLWNEWNQEYTSMINNGIPLEYFTFLIRKIKDYIETIIIEKYFQLGFKFDPITEESFIPTLSETIELEMEFKAISNELPMPVNIENH
ncbi:uncharacterized protein LOC126907805 [Daktulosphaira vitifoliae]|uniref:uncharacterized protein LOC126907805 n=1 Tax=Daktulosphaira vitifoliae TaxID=58002 RepID=UPI0021A9D154|nr:uncharacterized protein LOC126907805 [Daktulosphaira vitifoliae]